MVYIEQFMHVFVTLLRGKMVTRCDNVITV